jgi:hypothetical protein
MIKMGFCLFRKYTRKKTLRIFSYAQKQNIYFFFLNEGSFEFFGFFEISEKNQVF